MSGRPSRSLILVGGHEDRKGEKIILKELARGIGEGRLVLITAASSEPEELADEYRRAFRDLGLKHVDVLDIKVREQTHEDACLKKIEGAAGVYLSGGDQLRITSLLGGSPLIRAIRELQDAGALVGGTSAGAAALPEAMLVAGPGEQPFELRGLWMAPGLDLLHGIAVDTHFSQRGRMNRILGAVAQNPCILGLGLDEDTAVMISRGGERMRVLGAGAVYVVDGAGITYSSLGSDDPEGVVSIHNLRVHVLASGHAFDLIRREPVVPKQRSVGS